jgi:hypothetical protein
MGSKTNNLENKSLDYVLADAADFAPTAIFMALFTTDPTETGIAGTEVTGGAYVRVAITMGDAAAAGSKSNTVQVTFPVATALWGTITHFVIVDLASGALAETNTYYHGALVAPKLIDTDDQFVFPIGNITVTED